MAFSTGKAREGEKRERERDETREKGTVSRDTYGRSEADGLGMLPNDIVEAVLVPAGGAHPAVEAATAALLARPSTALCIAVDIPRALGAAHLQTKAKAARKVDE